MDIHQRDELWTDHDGQSRVMDYDAVEKELNRLEAEIERLRAALAWIDNTDPEMVAAAEEKFGFKLVVEQKMPQNTGSRKD